jgi:uncharacterized protein YraI
MNIQTKRTLLRAATATAVVCATALVLLPATSWAAPAIASSTVNVRSGPSTSFSVVDTLSPGEQVDVLGCRTGWCYVQKSGPDGYVSSSYLRRSSGGTATFEPNFNLSFNFPQGSVSVGTGGVSIGIGSGRPDRPERPPSGSIPGDVCFYSGSSYTGSRFCMDQGDMTPYVGAAWNNRISSIRNPDGYRVIVCDDAGYDICRTYTTSASSLGSFNNEISSIRIR